MKSNNNNTISIVEYAAAIRAMPIVNKAVSMDTERREKRIATNPEYTAAREAAKRDAAQPQIIAAAEREYTNDNTLIGHASKIAYCAVRICRNKAGENPVLRQLAYGFAFDAREKRKLSILFNADSNEQGTDIPFDGTLSTLSDSADLVNAAALAMIEADGEQATTEDYRPTEQAIKAAYKAVYHVIYESRNKRGSIKSVYVDDLQHNDNGEIVDTAYVRVTKYYDIDSIADYQYTMDMLGAISDRLTTRQAEILHYRMQGLGVQAIADKLGVDKSTITHTMDRIRKKAVDIGLNAEQA